MNTINNTQSPNFGMALKIKPEAKESLLKASKETLDSLKDAGNRLKDTKQYDLVVDKGPSYHIYDRNTGSYYDHVHSSITPMNAGEKDDTLKLTLSNAKDYMRKNLEFSGGEREAAFYLRNINDATSNLSTKLEAIEALETSNEYLAKKAAAENAKKTEQEDAVNELITKFGVDA